MGAGIAIINADRALSIFASAASFPTVGKEGPLYFARDVGKTYRWDFGTAAYVEFGGSAGVIDHGLLTGLADDDHPQYALDTDLANYQPIFTAKNANTVYAGPTSGVAAVPGFRGVVYEDFAASTYISASGSAQSIAAGTFTALIFPTETNDTLSEYNNTTGAFTPQASGLYLCWVSLESTTAGIADQRILVSITTTAGTDGERVLNEYTNSSAINDVSAARPINLVGGTTYYFNIYCSNAETLSGSALSIKRIG